MSDLESNQKSHLANEQLSIVGFDDKYRTNIKPSLLSDNDKNIVLINDDRTIIDNLHHRNNSSIISDSIRYNHNDGGMILSNNQNTIEINKDNSSDRLFPDYPLYCEGMHKPKLRGAIHMIYALLLPFGIIHLNLASNGNIYGQISSFIFVCSNLYCVGISALYHMGTWSYHTEVFIQKLDHCAIAVYATGVNFPLSFLLLPSYLGILLILSSSCACIWTCWNVFNNRPAVWRFFVVSSMVVFLFPVLYNEMTSFEFLCAVLNGVIQGIGSAVFVHRYPNPFPQLCGYHEIFHFITIIGMSITYICNWSIIHRTCNPYARHIDIIDVIRYGEKIR